MIIVIIPSFFNLSVLADCGIGLESGVFVATLAPGSPAARDCVLAVGDRLLAVNLVHKNFDELEMDDSPNFLFLFFKYDPI